MSHSEGLDNEFAFGRFRGAGQSFVGVVADGQIFRLESLLGGAIPVATSIEQLLPVWDQTLDAIEAWFERYRCGHVIAREVASDSVRALTPLNPTHVFQAAANYRRHVIELMVASPRPEHESASQAERHAFASKLMDERAASGTPTVFSGLPSSMCGPYDDVVIPHITERCDWELELAAVIGKRSRYLSRTDALAHVAGYTIVNDITMRDKLYPSGDSTRGGDWLACKSAPTFLPTGPYVLPARFVPDPMKLRITLRLNGEVMQDESTSDMIFGLDRLLEHTSTWAELLPGDLLLTGSPAGNGVHHGRFLAPGDVMEGSITGLGIQRNTAVAEVYP
jgi:2,4-diketo-3-deoxy-L-fuconate hydrolase